MDLIFAEATPAGRGGVSVVRISGSGARAVVETLSGALPRPRHAYLRELRCRGEYLDSALAIWFEDGHSFTGEEVVELHLHGAPVIVRRVVQVLREQGLRMADAGEFTRRAFINGRMDLSEVEGLGDLLQAETEAQRQLALRVANGELGRMAESWRNLLIRAGALVEVSVDFADEEVPEDIPPEVFHLLRKLSAELDQQISGFAAAEMVRTGFEVAVIGPPNAGKSSLINRLARRDVALVSEIPGTTRDVIEIKLDLKGLAVTFLDTAGLRESDDRIEAMGIDRAKERAITADLRLHLSEDGLPDPNLWREGDIVVGSKADILSHKTIAVSSVTGIGLDQLVNEVQATLSERVISAGLISHERQLASLIEARAAIEDIQILPPELLSESIRACAVALDRLLGRISADDYLDVIFGSFCIGK
jgi:tRNA modification GTPase